MGQILPKDGTAQGVAKARHSEGLYEPSKRLFLDPYAHAMFPGAAAQAWLGIERVPNGWTTKLQTTRHRPNN